PSPLARGEGAGRADEGFAFAAMNSPLIRPFDKLRATVSPPRREAVDQSAGGERTMTLPSPLARGEGARRADEGFAFAAMNGPCIRPFDKLRAIFSPARR